MKHYIITYIDAFYKVKTTGYIQAENKLTAIKNFGIVDKILDIKEI